MLESVARAEDIVKVHEARLAEKETTSLSPSEVEDYILTLKVFFNTIYFHTSYITYINLQQDIGVLVNVTTAREIVSFVVFSQAHDSRQLLFIILGVSRLTAVSCAVDG